MKLATVKKFPLKLLRPLMDYGYKKDTCINNYCDSMRSGWMELRLSLINSIPKGIRHLASVGKRCRL